MIKLYVAISALFFSVSVFAKDWQSPIDKKYLSKNPELFLKFDKAREILDSWGGEGEKLKEVDILLREVLSKDDTYAPAYREFGRYYIMKGFVKDDMFKNGSLNPSETSILKSLEIEPKYADSYVLLGHLYTKMKRYSEAEKALLEGEKIGTETPWLQLNRAELLKVTGKYSEALESYQKVVSKRVVNHKSYANALSGVTNMYWDMREYDKANDGFKKELEFSPHDAWILGNYANFLLFSFNDVDGAIEKGQQALDVMNYGVGRFILACALYTKWALLNRNVISSPQAKIYFDRAWSLYPYPDEVIEKTKGYANTAITASALQNWLVTHPDAVH